MHEIATTPAGDRPRAPPTAAWWPVLLIGSCLVLLPFGTLVELPVLVMAALGAGLWIRRGARFAISGANRLLSLVFALWWVPMAVAALDAVAPASAWRVVASFARFYLMGLFVIWALAPVPSRDRLATLGAAVLAVWTVDAVWQGVAGANLLGVESVAHHVTGLFASRGYKLGVAVACLSPLALWALRARPVWWQLAAWLALLAVVLLTGRRGALVMFAVASAGYLVIMVSSDAARFRKLLIAVPLLGAAAVTTLYHVSPVFEARVDQTLQLFSGDYELANQATSYRLPIWAAAWRVYLAHPVNGVGPRGFRHAYAEHAHADDFFMRAGTGVTHSHQMVLEVMAELGTLGLVGLLAAFVLVLVKTAPGLAAGAHAPYWLGLLAAVFPLNTHHAVHSSFWSFMLFFLITALVATAAPAAPDQNV